MKETFTYGQYSYEYFVETSDRKTLALEVLPDLRIIVKAPESTRLVEIESFLRRKWQWLERQLSELKKLKKIRSTKQFVSGESFYYLGRQYMLVVDSAESDAVKFERGKIHVYTTKGLRNSNHNQKLLESWFTHRRKVVFNQEYTKAVKLFDFEPIPRLGERVMARRWGSYMGDGKVLLNPRLIEAPREAIYYVCIHELCHKISRKHDEVFSKELVKRLPNWQRIKDSLEVRHG